MSEKNRENPEYSEYYSHGEYNTGGIGENYRPKEINNLKLQPESDKAGENPDLNAHDSGKHAGVGNSSDISGILARLAGGVTSLAVFVLVFLLVSINDIPDTKVTDLYAGADFIDYIIEAEDPGDYDMVIRLTENEKVIYESKLEEGVNGSTINDLSSQTSYKFTVSGKSAFGRTTVVSKTIKTAGKTPKAEIRNTEWKENENGTVSVAFDIRISDPSGLFESADIVWTLNDGEISGGDPLQPENSRYAISSLEGSGKFDVFLYCTIDGDRLLYSSSSVRIDPVPLQFIKLEPEGTGSLSISYSYVSFGYDVDYIKVDFDDYSIKDITVRKPSQKDHRFVVNDLKGDVGMTFILGYVKSGRAQSTEEKMTFTFAPEPEVSAGITSISDSRDDLTVVILEKGGEEFRKSLVLTSDNDTKELDRLSFTGSGEESGSESTVAIDGMLPGVPYDAELRFYCYGDGYISVPLGRLIHDADVRFEIDFTDPVNLGFRLIYEDQNSYYSNFRAEITDGEKTISLKYDDEGQTFSLPSGSGWTGTGGRTWVLTVTADSSRPSSPGTGITVASLNIR